MLIERTENIRTKDVIRMEILPAKYGSYHGVLVVRVCRTIGFDK